MSPADLRRVMTGLNNIEREDLERIGIVKPGAQGNECIREFYMDPIRATLRLTDNHQQALINHFFKGVKR